MNKYFIKIVFAYLLLGLFTLPASAASESSLKVIIPNKTEAYVPGDSIKISWTPASELIQTIALVPLLKGDVKSYVLHGDKVNGDPIITSGTFNYTFENYFIPSGYYYVGIGFSNTDSFAAQSSKKIKVENHPSLYFGTDNGEVNSVSVLPGDSVKLKWEAASVKKCKASSFPSNPKWRNSVAASGTKTIRVLTSTTFYLNCKNGLGEVTTRLEVNTQAPERSTASIIPSTTFVNYNFPLGTTQQTALSHSTSITLFNSSAVQPIYYHIVTDKKPGWVNTGYTTSQLMLSPNGTAGVGAFADPSQVSQAGIYVWNLKLEGNFSNSPLVIPITMTVTK